MKKKLTIYYSFMIILLITIPLMLGILLFCNIASMAVVKKDAITEQDFINKATILNTKVSNLDFTFDENQPNVLSKETREIIDKHVKKSLLAKNDNLTLRYINCTDEKMAHFIYEQEYKTFIKPSNDNKSENSTNIQTNLVSWNGMNFELKQTKKDLINYTFARINDSYMAIISYDDIVYKKAKEVFNLNDTPSSHTIISFFAIFNIMLIYSIFVITILCYVPRAYIFKKANTHSLIAFVPFASDYFLCKIADKEGWKMAFLYIPVVQIVYQVILSLRIAKVFNKSELFGVGIFFAPIILLPIIAFDDSKYTPDFSEEESKNIL